MASLLLYFILFFLVFEFVLSQVLNYLNYRDWDKPLPAGFQDLYSSEELQRAKAYDLAKQKLGFSASTVSLAVYIGMLVFKGFAMIDASIHALSNSAIMQSLLFFAVIGLGSAFLSLPFSIYQTFVIEEKFGFNRTDAKTFVLDLVKGAVLSVVVGAPLLALLVWLYGMLGGYFWISAWALVTLVSIFFAMFYSSLILPLFNKMSPLEEGELRSSIESYAAAVSFPLKSIFIIDGSKRSTKANAFFSGLGPKKSIVLYDTLVKEQSKEEITAVLAHEVGHFKKKHIIKGLFISMLSTAVTFFIFGQLAGSEELPKVLGTEKSFHIALLVFSMIYSPVSLITTPLSYYLSRRNEFEADAYAKKTYGAAHLSASLRRLSVSHLNHPQPHPWYVFFHYSHPPLLARLLALSK
jgi:STE24 endopeptidase